MRGSDENEGGFILFRRDVSKIPCFRDSLLTGVSGGILSGLGYFMYSSNVKKSTNVGFLSYVMVTLGAWSYCRYRFNQEVIRNDMLKKAIQAKILAEGTEMEEPKNSPFKEV